ncbi:dTMP kinase [bacterium]|nr:dTMP kinase [bacterium]
MIDFGARPVLRGFIAIEGLDGAGTSTQSGMLEAGLAAAGLSPVLSMEPTSGPIGTLIKQIMRGRLKSAETREETETQLAYLFAADRFDHLYNEVDGVRASIQRGRVAISTRYFFSSYVYNGRTPEKLDLVDRLNRDFPVPELTIYLHVPLEVSLARLANRDVREFYEQEAELKRVGEAYATLLRTLGDRLLTFESTGDPRELSSRIVKAVLERLER